MKITRANVEKYATEKGWKPVQIDGIPEGFSWEEDDIEIGGRKHKGRVIKFKPLKEWDEGISYE